MISPLLSLLSSPLFSSVTNAIPLTPPESAEPLPQHLQLFQNGLEAIGIILVIFVVGGLAFRWFYGVLSREMAISEREARAPLYSRLNDRSLYGNLGDMPDPTGEFEFAWQKFHAMDRRRLEEYRGHCEDVKRTSIFDAVVSLVAGAVVALGLCFKGVVSEHVVAVSLLVLIMLISPMSKPSLSHTG
jgi:hypothetical protein